MIPVITIVYVVSTAIKSITVKWEGYFLEIGDDDVYANLSLTVSFPYLSF